VIVHWTKMCEVWGSNPTTDGTEHTSSIARAIPKNLLLETNLTRSNPVTSNCGNMGRLNQNQARSMLRIRVVLSAVSNQTKLKHLTSYPQPVSNDLCYEKLALLKK